MLKGPDANALHQSKGKGAVLAVVDAAQSFEEFEKERRDKATGNPKRKAEAASLARKLELVPFNKLRPIRSRRDLVQGLVPRHGLTLIYGPPKSGKSFFAFDLAMHVATGRPYRGRKVHQGPVVYVYCEGQHGAGARADAWRHKHMEDGGEHVPFFMLPVAISLCKDGASLEQATKGVLGDVPPAAIVIDTLNRSIDGSESNDQDMTRYIQACDRLHQTFECALLVVHHSGHKEDRPRGHSSLIGAADAVIGVKRNRHDQVIATLEMSKDSPARTKITSRLEVVSLGQDEDGDEMHSCVIVPSEPIADTAAGRLPSMTDDRKLALTALKQAIERNVEAASVGGTVEGLSSAKVSKGEWRACFYQLASDRGPDAKKAAFGRAFKNLCEIALVEVSTTRANHLTMTFAGWPPDVLPRGHAGLSRDMSLTLEGVHTGTGQDIPLKGVSLCPSHTERRPFLSSWSSDGATGDARCLAGHRLQVNVILTKSVPPEAVLGLRQGSRVHIEGFIALARWKAPDGSQRQGLGVRASAVGPIEKVARKRPSDGVAAGLSEAAVESQAPARLTSPDDPIPF